MEPRPNCPPKLNLYGPLLSLGQAALAGHICLFGFGVAQWPKVGIFGLWSVRQWVAAPPDAVPRASGASGGAFFRDRQLGGETSRLVARYSRGHCTLCIQAGVGGECAGSS